MKKVIEMFPEFHQEKLETTDIKDENNLIVVDTNFLLQILELPIDIATKYVDSLKSIKRNLYIPYLVALEFHFNKSNKKKTKKRNADSYFKQVESALNQLKSSVQNTDLIKMDIENDKLKHLIGNLEFFTDDFLTKVNLFVRDEITDKEDEVYKELLNIISDSIGDVYEQEWIYEIEKEGEKRFAEAIPPGFNDENKDGIRKYNGISYHQEKGGFIQAWGDLGKKEHYRLIIDCLLNIQLLFFAYQETGDQKYYDIAESHFYVSANNVIRDDASSFHTFYFDPETGQPLKGVTRQGYSDDSCWARGQSWGVYGIPLTYRHLKDESCFDLFKGVTNYFLNRLPKDHVSYWDLIFNDGSDQSRDSSATAIAVCGIHEMLKHLPEVDADKDIYKHAMHAMLRSLIEHYANDQFTPGGTSLLHGVYSWHSGKGVDEGNIWGDYYYLEALIRFYKDWNLYW